tara:strand:- start:242 stop:913 length:672 start_codon:yes stop_codon:yes gene_type:complete
MRLIAIIPARGGSKGIPGKNIIQINGKPLIQYTIDMAVNVKYFSSIWVSSDSKDIMDACRHYEGLKFHNRASDLATDNSPIVDTIMEIVKLEKNDFDAIILLQPTSPLRTVKQVENAVEKLYKNKEFNSLVSVCPMDDIHPARMYWKNNLELNSIMPEFQYSRRQDIPKAWYRNGAIYIVRKEAFLKEKQIILRPILGYEMPRSELLNIDEPIDLKFAQVLLK